VYLNIFWKQIEQYLLLISVEIIRMNSVIMVEENV